MVRIQKINDLEFTLESLSDCLVQVVYQEQVGWFGVNLGEDVQDNPFAWTTDQDSCTQDGLMGARSAADPAQALEDLSAQLAEMQSALDAERASDPRHNLGNFLDTLPQAEVEKDVGWRSLVGGGLTGLSRGKDILQDRATKGRDILQDRATKGRDILQDRAAKGVEAVREAASPSRACEREGHVFDDVRLIGSSNNLPRFCRRCRNLINVAEENRDTAANRSEARQDTS